MYYPWFTFIWPPEALQTKPRALFSTSFFVVVVKANDIKIYSHIYGQKLIWYLGVPLQDIYQFINVATSSSLL